MLSHTFTTSKTLPAVERRLNSMGYSIGIKYLELTSLRSNFTHSIQSSKSSTAVKFINVVDLLHFITTVFWQSLFGKNADGLEMSEDKQGQYMIIERDPLFTRYIDVPREYQGLNCEAFVSGIVEGAMDAAGFPCECSAHEVEDRCVYLVRLSGQH